MTGTHLFLDSMKSIRGIDVAVNSYFDKVNKLWRACTERLLFLKEQILSSLI